MPTVALLMLQVETVAVSGAPPPGTSGVSLLHRVPPPTCVKSADEITVCGKDTGNYRLPLAASQSEVTGPPKAEWKLFGDSTVGVGTSASDVGGYPSNAAMVTIKIPF